MTQTQSTDVTFTFDWYRSLLDTLDDHGYRFRTYDQPLDDGDVLLRHDVDWAPRNALTLARIEADRDITATYCFLISSPLYNPHHKPVRGVIETLTDLGHDVALHFSTHEHFTAEPTDDTLIARVEEERTALATVTDDLADTVSFHRPPEWVFRRDYDGFISTYERRFFEDITYVGDSNQRWRDTPPLEGPVPDRLQVLVHPGLWGVDDATFDQRFDTHVGTRLNRTADYLEDQFIEKRYNIDDYCTHLDDA